jgi:CBS domain-containing protein
MLIRDLMTTDVVTARVDTPLARLIDLMLTTGVSGLPVVDEDGRLVGIVAQRDVLRLMHRTDPEVDLAVRAVLADLDIDAISSTTVEGIVKLEGVASSAGELEQIVRRLADIPGVIDVRTPTVTFGPGGGVATGAGSSA